MQKEYGWSRDQVLDYPLCSMRQDIELLNQREADTARMNMQVTAWHARTVAQFIVQTAQIDKQGAEKLWRQIKEIQLGSADAQGGIHDTRSIEEIIEQGAIYPEDRENSTEAFMGFMAMADAKAKEG